MQKHILVVSQYFYPEQFRINDICEEWVKQGYKVTVVTGIPNYPHGKFFKGYGLFKRRKESFNGINIIRLPIISRGKAKICLALNYFSFVFSGFFFSLFTSIRADYVFTYEVSPIYQAKIGNWYSKHRKVPHILYVMDLWPDNVQAVGNIKNKIILKTIYKNTQKIYSDATFILTSSKSFIDSISSMGIDRDKIDFWPQYAEDFYCPIDKDTIKIQLPETKWPRLCFAGNIGKAQGLEILVSSSDILRDRKIFVQFLIIGEGRAKDDLVSLIKEKNLEDYFLFLPKKPATEIPQYLSLCDGAILTLLDDPIFNKTIPAKLQSYMACGIPIIASASGEVAGIIDESHSGLVSPAGDALLFANIVETFSKTSDYERKKLGSNALTYSSHIFDKKVLLEQVNALFKKLEGE